MSRARDYLIVVRAGDSSLHPAWLKQEGDDRLWDLHISYFGQRSDPFGPLPDGVTLSYDAGPKYLGLRLFIDNSVDLLRRYRFIAFPDDDLQVVQGSWSALFELAAAQGFALCQPSLDQRSFYSHSVTLQQPRFLYRLVDMVEVMAPVFEAATFWTLTETFTENRSSWGLDHIWADRIQKAGGALAVVDSVGLLHTRRVGGGAQYKGLGGSAAVDPWQDMHELLARHGLKKKPGASIGGVDLAGKAVTSRRRLNPANPRAYLFKKLKNLMKINVIQV